MGKTPKKKKKRDLERRLRRLGLRKALAKRIADNAPNVGGQLPKSARKTIKGMRAKVDDLGSGVRRPAAENQEADESAMRAAGAEAAKREDRKTLKKKLAKKLRKAKKKSAKKAKKAKKKAARAEGRKAEQAAAAEA